MDALRLASVIRPTTSDKREWNRERQTSPLMSIRHERLFLFTKRYKSYIYDKKNTKCNKEKHYVSV